MLRQASVAGYFYPSDKKEIKDFISAYAFEGEKTVACAVLVPHAGYIYSGATAVKTLSKVKIPETVILIGPNHTGQGTKASVYPEGAWETPLGTSETDDDVIGKLCSTGFYTRDTKAHAREHSLEVIVPIIQYFNPNAKIVCITMKFLAYDDLKTASDSLKYAVGDKNCLVIISSDFNHFENERITEKKDALAIDSLLKMDENSLYNKILDYNISMCGVIPACIGILYCKSYGAYDAQLIEHTHSGKVSGDNERVVGYAGIIIKKEG